MALDIKRPVAGGFHVVMAAEMLIALAFGTLDLMFFIIHIRSWYVSTMQGTDTQSACKQGNESFPICGGGSFLPAAAHVCQRLCLQMSYYGCGTA